MRRMRVRSMLPAAMAVVVFGVFSMALADGAGSPVRIVRMRLYFENGRPKITVRERQPAFFAQVEIRFRGRGLLAGYWEVDGRLVARFAQHVLSTGSATTVYQRTPRPLPTFAPGSHRVRAVITRPGRSIPFPVAVYFVTGQMHREPWGGR